MPAESKIQSKIVEYLTKSGYYCNKSIRMSRSGFPDLVAFKGSDAYYFEVKAPGGIVDLLQQNTIDKLNAVRKIAFVVWSFEEFKLIWLKLP